MDFLLHCDKKYHIDEPLLDECINKNFKAKGRQIDASQLHALRCMVQNQITFVDGAGGTAFFFLTNFDKGKLKMIFTQELENLLW
jgi:hypothetical protein